jgi:hypothetical protein
MARPSARDLTDRELEVMHVFSGYKLMVEEWNGR